jgi:hypothetical protein
MDVATTRMGPGGCHIHPVPRRPVNGKLALDGNKPSKNGHQVSVERLFSG